MTDKRIDCGVCGRKARGPWPTHASTDAHRRASMPAGKRVRIAAIRREKRGFIITGSSDPWSSDDGRDWDAEQESAQ